MICYLFFVLSSRVRCVEKEGRALLRRGEIVALNGVPHSGSINHG